MEGLRRCAVEVFNGQRTRRIDAALLGRMARWLAAENFPAGGRLGVHLIGAAEMARMNEEFLGHEGSTDVLTFDYGEGLAKRAVLGEIYISVDDAVAQAPRFGVGWEEELVRYLAHGTLHLRGYDDRKPAARRRMKMEENRMLKELSRRFDWGRLERVQNAARRK